MTTTTLDPKCHLHVAPQPNWLQRLIAHVTAPSIEELDAATLKDIGASEEARARAELRDAYRHWFAPSRLHGF
jgi:hypothetical protein